jgi:hypothetical protein
VWVPSLAQVFVGDSFGSRDSCAHKSQRQAAVFHGRKQLHRPGSESRHTSYSEDHGTAPPSLQGATIGGIRRFQPHLRQPVAQRIARQPQQPRGLALVAIRAAQRLADQILLVLIERQTVGQKVIRLIRRAAARRHFQLDIGGVQALAEHITRLRSITFSSSRTLPGQ